MAEKTQKKIQRPVHRRFSRQKSVGTRHARRPVVFGDRGSTENLANMVRFDSARLALQYFKHRARIVVAIHRNAYSGCSADELCHVTWRLEA